MQEAFTVRMLAVKLRAVPGICDLDIDLKGLF